MRGVIHVFVPVSEANVAAVIGWHTTTINDDSKENESNTCDGFHQAQNKVDLQKLLNIVGHDVDEATHLSITSYIKGLDDIQSNQ